MTKVLTTIPQQRNTSLNVLDQFFNVDTHKFNIYKRHIYSFRRNAWSTLAKSNVLDQFNCFQGFLHFFAIHRVLKCDVTKKTNFFRTSRFIAKKYSRKYELWWTFYVNWAKDGWDMSRRIYKYCHTFSRPIYVPVRTKSKITENLWRFFFVQLLISQRSVVRFLSNFHHIFYFESSFWILSDEIQ